MPGFLVVTTTSTHFAEKAAMTYIILRKSNLKATLGNLFERSIP